jgi:hypothetical protein
VLLRDWHARTRGPSDRFVVGVGIVYEGARAMIGPLVGHLGSASLLALITG